MKVSWFSAGVSSAVATKIANPDKIIYVDIEDQRPDTYRFIADCEKWFGNVFCDKGQRQLSNKRQCNHRETKGV